MEKNLRVRFTDDFQKIRENVYFILVEPESPGNMGAAARALKTSGFKKLIFVNPKIDRTIPEARWMAHQSEDIMDNAVEYQTLSDAIADKRLVIATTMRKRHFKFPFYTPEQVTDKISEIAINHPVAIVFGRERTGLTNEELTQCHIHSTILTATTHPALNLAQSVMIYAHTFFKGLNTRQKEYKYDLASQYELEKFYEHLARSMQKVNFVPRDSIDSFTNRFKRLLGRSMAERRDIRLLHKLIQIYEKKIDVLENKTDEPEKQDYKIY